MPNPMVAMVGGSVGGALIQSNAAKNAAKTQAGAAQSGIDIQREMFDETQALLKPYVDAGIEAQAGLAPYA